jgi:hypothetical protein
MKKCKRKAKYTIYRKKYQLPLKPCLMANTNFPPQISKMRRIKGFGEDIGQLSLGVYVSHLNVSFSQRDLSGSGVSSQHVSSFCARLDF